MLHFPFKLLRQIFWILILLLAIVLCTNTTLAKAQDRESNMRRACAWQGDIGTSVERAYIYAWSNMWDTYAIPETMYEDILALDVSDSFWIPTAEYGYFDTPSDETETLLVLVFFTEEGKRKIYLTSAPSTPDVYYAYLFQNLKPYANTDGSYYGVHPCRVFRIDATTIMNFWYAGTLIED